MKDFAAIDFETANEQPSSVCCLIHPEPEYYQWFCQRVHGLGPCDTDGAPVFPYVWEKVMPLIEGLPLVSHVAIQLFEESRITSQRVGEHLVDDADAVNEGKVTVNARFPSRP